MERLQVISDGEGERRGERKRRGRGKAGAKGEGKEKIRLIQFVLPCNSANFSSGSLVLDCPILLNITLNINWIDGIDIMLRSVVGMAWCGGMVHVAS